MPKFDARGAKIFLDPTSGQEYSKVQIARFLGKMKAGDKTASQANHGFDKAWDALKLVEDEETDAPDAP